MDIRIPVCRRERRDNMSKSMSETCFGPYNDEVCWDDRTSISDFGVKGKDSLLAEQGKKGGSVGIVNGFENSRESSDSRGNEGDDGDVPGVLRRT